MSRRLVPNRRRERAVQQALIVRASARMRQAMTKEIIRAMREVARTQLSGGNLDKARQRHRDNIESILVNAWTAVANQFSSRMEQLIGRAQKSDERERRIREWIAAHKDMEADEVSQTTIDQVLQRIDKGLADGRSITQIANDLQETIPGLSASRATMIARTEVQSAAQAGQLESAKASGLAMEKVWVSSGDARVRTFEDGEFDHLEVDGQRVPIDDPFIVGGEELQHPGDFMGSPGNVINCRCAAVYELAE